MGVDDDFTVFAGARWASLVRAGVLLGCTPDAAEDLAQTALTRCFVSWRKVSGAEDRDAYVYRILLNCHRDSRRRRWGEMPTDRIPERAEADPTHTVDLADAVGRALATLSPKLREAVVLRYYAHLSERQVAAVLGIAPGTVKSRVSRGLNALAEDPALNDLDRGGTW